MPSLDFEQEERHFHTYYDNKRSIFEGAKDTFLSLVSERLKEWNLHDEIKIEGRVKDKDECIRKFQRKYRARLEADEDPYEIRSYISDLIGIRIICLYEDRISTVAKRLTESFKIIEVTDKIAAIESTEDSFGYKGLHMDVSLNDEMLKERRYKPFAGISCEVQVRSLIQDAWSVLDHKIKYKKSIPNELKRRINVLSALFELADREFKEIRQATEELMQQATKAAIDEIDTEMSDGAETTEASSSEKIVNAFNFLRIAGHFFKDFEFEDYKVDDFVQDILHLQSDFKRADLHHALIENLKTVRDYRDDFIKNNPDRIFSPYSSMRHCLYLHDPDVFQKILSKGSRTRFDQWRKQER